MAQYEEITIDQGSDVTITLNLTDTTGAKKNLTNYALIQLHLQPQFLHQQPMV